MKMRNEDLKKITEIKQYLLDPPTSFKLQEYALTYLQNAINVLVAYPNTEIDIDYLEQLITQLKNNEIEQAALRSTLIQAGVMLSKLTNK